MWINEMNESMDIEKSWIYFGNQYSNKKISLCHNVLKILYDEDASKYVYLREVVMSDTSPRPLMSVNIGKCWYRPQGL